MPFFTKHVGKNSYTWSGVKKLPSPKVFLKTWNHQIDTKGYTGGATADTVTRNWITPSGTIPFSTTNGWYGHLIGQNGKLFYAKTRGSKQLAFIYDPASGASGDISTLISNGHGATFDLVNCDRTGTIMEDGRLMFVDEGTTNQMILIDPETFVTENVTIGGAGYRASSIARHRNGKYYAAQYQVNNLYEIDMETKTSKIVYTGNNTAKSEGILIGASEKVYTIPYNSYGLIYDPNTGTGTTFGVPGTEASFGTQFYNGVLAQNGCIYVAPLSGSNVLKINTYTDEVSYISTPVSSFVGGTVGLNGKIYFPPVSGTNFLVIDPADDSLETIGSFSGSLKWASMGPACFDGSIYPPHFYGANDFCKLQPSGGIIPPKFSYSPYTNTS